MFWKIKIPPSKELAKPFLKEIERSMNAILVMEVHDEMDKFWAKEREKLIATIDDWWWKNKVTIMRQTDDWIGIKAKSDTEVEVTFNDPFLEVRK